MNGEKLGCAPSFFASSWRLADVIFAPRDCFVDDDEEMGRIYLLRSIAGTIIILCVAVRYHHFNGLSETFGAVFQGINWTVEFACLSVVPAGVAVVLYTRPGKRKDALTQLRYPVSAFGAWLLIIYGLLLLQRWVDHAQDDIGLGLLAAILNLVALVWLASFMVRTFYQMATGLFRLRDGHPLLPPFVTTLAAWALAVKGLLAGGSSEGEPSALIVILLIGGPVSLTILAAFEIEQLKRKYPDEFPFRNGPIGADDSGGGRSPFHESHSRA